MCTQVPLAADLIGPLLAQPGEPQVVQRLAPVLGLGVGGAVESLAGLSDDDVVGQGSASQQNARASAGLAG